MIGGIYGSRNPLHPKRRPEYRVSSHWRWHSRYGGGARLAIKRRGLLGRTHPRPVPARARILLASFFSTSVAPGCCRTGLSRLRHWSSAWTTYAPFITHDVGEAVFISDRVIAMTRRPGRVKRDERIKAPKPRDYDFLGLPEFIEHEHELVLAVQSEVDPDGVKDKAA